MKFAAPLGLMAIKPDQVEAVANPMQIQGTALPTLEEAVDAGIWLCGPPQLIIDYLKNVEEEFPGVERVNVGAVMGMSRKVFKDQLTMFAEEVMPAFKGKVEATVPAD